MYRVVAAGMLALALALPALAGGMDDFNHGLDAQNRGDNDVAIDAFGRAVASGELSKGLGATALIDRGIAYERKKRNIDAIADFSAALALNPESFDAVFQRMMIYQITAQGRLAETDCAALVRVRASIPALYEDCGIVNWENGDFAPAAGYYETAINLGAKPSATTVLWFEITRLRAGEPDEARYERLAKDLNLDGWPSPIVDLYLGKLTPDAVLAAAEKSTRQASVPGFSHFMDYAPPSGAESDSLQARRCQSAFFVGEWYFLNRNLEKAKTQIGAANTYCGKWLPAETELARLTQK